MVGSAGSGRTALPHSDRTLPGVSAPSRVVRSIIEIAASIAHNLASVLIERVARLAALASAPTWSTPGKPWRNRRSDISERARSANSDPAVRGAAPICPLLAALRADPLLSGVHFRLRLPGRWSGPHLHRPQCMSPTPV